MPVTDRTLRIGHDCPNLGLREPPGRLELVVEVEPDRLRRVGPAKAAHHEVGFAVRRQQLGQPLADDGERNGEQCMDGPG